MEPLIAFQAITKRFGDKIVIKDLTLPIHKNEIFGIIGRSGAGKSTLLKMLIGFYTVDQGTILYRGKNITNNAAFMKKIVGYCTQENSFYPELTVHENIEYYGRLYGLGRKELLARQEEVLRLVGLSLSKHAIASTLSGGMKRRLDFAISLLHKPSLLILDEPTTGLDPITEKQIWELIKALSREGISVIVISHMLDYVALYCDTVGFLSKGQIVLAASPSSLKKKYAFLPSFTAIFEHILEEKT